MTNTASFDVEPLNVESIPVTIGMEGSVERVKLSAGQLVFWCWLDDEVSAELGDDVSPALQLLYCAALIGSALHARDLGGPAPTPALAPPVEEQEGALVRTTSAVGCHMHALPILLHMHNGKVMKANLIKPIKLKASLIHYRCRSTGARQTITITSGTNLRKALGKHLNLGLYRPKKSHGKGKLSFTFHWHA